MGNPFEKKKEIVGAVKSIHDAVASHVDEAIPGKRLVDSVLSKKPVEPEFIQETQLKEAKEKIKELDSSKLFKAPSYGETHKKLRFNHKGEKDPAPGSEYQPPSVVQLKPRLDIAKICMFISVLGIVAIVMMAQSPFMGSPVVIIFLLIIIMPCFLSMGVVLGWLFLNIDMRCKILRRMRGKNYGIIHFVLRGSQHLVTRIMDLDGDVIVSNMRMWVIDDKGVHYIDRDGKKQHWADITSDHIKTLPANIPCLYLDYETMVPLKFYKEQSKSDPLQVGSTHLGYIANQIAKNMAFKKTMTFFYIIVIALLAVTLVIAVQEAMWIDEFRKDIPIIKDRIAVIEGFLMNASMVNMSGVVPGGP